MADMKFQDMKMADRIAGHENARHERMQFYNSNKYKNNSLSTMLTAMNKKTTKIIKGDYTPSHRL